MADYRLSAKVISRAKGQSSVASAAYRSACRMTDERTGELHDYTRKHGVVHSEILAPDNAPDWMRDRAQLWNSVEKVERRKDAQLSREIQLSLPHELDAAQRLDLTRRFVKEQFIAKGMIADINIHGPGKSGDDRNHHAHVMLTMRELMGEGFAKKKNRDWNDAAQLKDWRREWAQHQNREFERLGFDVRVDHRSYEDRGIDREATQHLGPTAHDMERKGKRSDKGEQNRAIQKANSMRADFHQEVVAVKLAAEREQQSKFEHWKQRKLDELDAAQKLSDLDLSRKHHTQSVRLEQRLNDLYGEHKNTLKAELSATERRLQKKGVVKVLRDVFGHTRSDSAAKEAYLKTLADIERRMQEQRGALRKQQEIEKRREKTRQAERRKWKERGIDKAKPRGQYKNAPNREHWKKRIKKADLLPTEKQTKLLKRQGLKPEEFNRVSAAQEIDKIAKAQGWKKTRAASRPPDKSERRKTQQWRHPPAQEKEPERKEVLSGAWKRSQTGSNDNAVREPERSSGPTRKRGPS